jgi:probable rRNA maturation factor
MSLSIDVATENARTPLGRDAIASIARATLRHEHVRDALISITLVDRPAIRRLNTRHLHHKRPTDVISFAFTRATRSDPVVGDIYICPSVASENAKSRGESVRDEVARLVVHGILHVLGYDHPEDGGRESSDMWMRQERLLRRLGRGAHV